ncbi:MAG: HAD-IIIA family hydrolase [Lewinella sp.]|nr:HAD-IIIA family hydrolase [Lewinella sp.]
MTKPTLFLDRDGVINRRLPGDYVREPAQFDFLPGVLAVWPRLNALFQRIIIITNQQGIGKGLMTETDLRWVHAYLRAEVAAAGGRLDGIYTCPHLRAAACACRKPKDGLVRQAMADFPDIQLAGAVLAGDSLSDLRLGARLGLTNIWITTKEEDFSSIREAQKAEEGFYISAALPGLAALPDWWLAQEGHSK